MNGKQLTQAQDTKFPNDGFPFQIEMLGLIVTPPDHYGMGGCTDESWVVIENRGDSTRAVVYESLTQEDCEVWIYGDIQYVRETRSGYIHPENAEYEEELTAAVEPPVDLADDGLPF